MQNNFFCSYKNNNCIHEGNVIFQLQTKLKQRKLKLISSYKKPKQVQQIQKSQRSSLKQNMLQFSDLAQQTNYPQFAKKYMIVKKRLYENTEASSKKQPMGNFENLFQFHCQKGYLNSKTKNTQSKSVITRKSTYFIQRPQSKDERREKQNHFNINQYRSLSIQRQTERSIFTGYNTKRVIVSQINLNNKQKNMYEINQEELLKDIKLQDDSEIQNDSLFMHARQLSLYQEQKIIGDKYSIAINLL